jgi:hypothetical protein
MKGPLSLHSTAQVLMHQTTGRIQKYVRISRLDLVAIIVFAAVLLLIICIEVPRRGVTESNVLRIHTGMCRAEVIELFGGPAAEILPGPLAGKDGDLVRYLEETARTRETWNGADGMAVVYFEASGTVVFANWVERLPRESIEETLRRWFAGLGYK